MASGEKRWAGVMSKSFFFQAEDGIRDIGVTGVQTCALPISAPPSKRNLPDLDMTYSRGETVMDPTSVGRTPTQRNRLVPIAPSTSSGSRESVRRGLVGHQPLLELARICANSRLDGFCANVHSVYRDSWGKRLVDYPRPSVAVDTAVLTVPDADPRLSVLLVRRAGESRTEEWALPGTFLHEGETRSEEHTSELQSRQYLVCRLLLEKKKQ